MNEEERKAYMKEYCKKNKEKLNRKSREYHQKNKEKILKRNKEWREKNEDKLKKYSKEYYQKNKKKRLEQSRKYQKEQYHKNPKFRKKGIARSKANKVKIPKRQLCEVCNKRLATERHHENYDKPLEVMFVCKKCHKIKNNDVKYI